MPTADASEEAAKPERRSPPPEGRSAGFPGALKLVAGLALLGIVFLVIAIVGGSGGGDDEPAEAPAPVAAPPAQDGGDGAAAEPTELGYPAFATGNTTRVGGADPAANAAGVALAVFPSVTAAQRPAAVTLVGEEDWAGGIAASVLMAEPVRAPVLISAADGAPDATAEALAALRPGGDKSTKGASAFAIGEVAAGTDGKVTKVAGGSPATEAAAIARLRERLAGSPPDHFVLAPEAAPELAMPAAAWAARSGDPVLFSATEKLPKATADALERHPDVPVYVLGPSSAISSGVVRETAAIAKQVKRVSGEDPVANAIAFARYDDEDFGWSINDPGHGFVLTRTDEPLNAAAASPLSASGTWGPLLLTDDAGSLPAELRSYFLDVKPGYTKNPTRAFYNHVWVIGDQEAIDVNQQAEVNELAELTKIGSAP